MYIALEPPNKLVVYSPKTLGSDIPVKMFELAAHHMAEQAAMTWYDADGLYYGTLSGNALDHSMWLQSVRGKLNLYSLDGVEASGNLHVTGDLSCTGQKPAVIVTKNYGLRYTYATEAPELIIWDRGQTHLYNGEATVYLDPIYLETIEPDTESTPWQIWVDCYGENDVYVSEVGSNYFKIKERNGGISNNKVIWKHEAIRTGYANIRLMEVVN
jgi:hypothetical protein